MFGAMFRVAPVSLHLYCVSTALLFEVSNFTFGCAGCTLLCP